MSNIQPNEWGNPRTTVRAVFSWLVTNAIWVIEVSVNFTKKQIMGTRKYGHLWQPIILPYGYRMYSKWQKFRMSNNEPNVHVVSCSLSCWSTNAIWVIEVSTIFQKINLVNSSSKITVFQRLVSERATLCNEWQKWHWIWVHTNLVVA